MLKMSDVEQYLHSIFKCRCLCNQIPQIHLKTCLVWLQRLQQIIF